MVIYTTSNLPYMVNLTVYYIFHTITDNKWCFKLLHNLNAVQHNVIVDIN